MSNSDVAIQGIVFHPDGAFDISYAEQRDITPKVVVVRQLLVSPGTANTDDVLDSLKDLLDECLGKMHEAPERISRR